MIFEEICRLSLSMGILILIFHLLDSPMDHIFSHRAKRFLWISLMLRMLWIIPSPVISLPVPHELFVSRELLARVIESAVGICDGLPSNTETIYTKQETSAGIQKSDIFGNLTTGAQNFHIFGNLTTGAQKSDIFGNPITGVQKFDIFGNLSIGIQKFDIFGNSITGVQKSDIFGNPTTEIQAPGTSANPTPEVPEAGTSANPSAASKLTSLDPSAAAAKAAVLYVLWLSGVIAKCAWSIGSCFYWNSGRQISAQTRLSGSLPVKAKSPCKQQGIKFAELQGIRFTELQGI